ncbi:MAG TPA: hypothetical protein HA362_04250 [Nanoarchaeota archaeon]|nr:hypothetical protein [Nanoarchaeota archaeon]
MDKMTRYKLMRAGSYAAAGVAAVVGTGLVVSQCGKPDMPWQEDALNGAAALVEQSEEHKPADALGYAMHTIEMVADGDSNIDGVSDLERDLKAIKASVEREPSLYPPVMQYAAGRIRSVVRDNRTSKAAKYGGMGLGLAGIALVAFGATRRRP